MPHLCNFISFLRGQDCQTDVSYNRERVHMSTPYPILHMRTEERNNCPYKKTHQAFCNRDHQQSAVEKCQAESSRESLTVDAEKRPFAASGQWICSSTYGKYASAHI